VCAARHRPGRPRLPCCRHSASCWACVDAVNTFRVSAGRFAYFRVVSRTLIRYLPRSAGFLDRVRFPAAPQFGPRRASLVSPAGRPARWLRGTPTRLAVLGPGGELHEQPRYTALMLSGDAVVAGVCVADNADGCVDGSRSRAGEHWVPHPCVRAGARTTVRSSPRGWFQHAAGVLRPHLVFAEPGLLCRGEDVVDPSRSFQQLLANQPAIPIASDAASMTGNGPLSWPVYATTITRDTNNTRGLTHAARPGASHN
jgi:hypothetical protein